jgi:hypothetical protein
VRTRINALVAVMIASSALGGAAAAPASADPPLYNYFHRCQAVGFDVSSQGSAATSSEAHRTRNEVRQFCRTVDGTFTSTITRL